MKKRNSLVQGIIYLALFVVLIILVKTVDVAAIGPENTEIGLSHINQTVHEVFGINMFWYKLTEVFGILALLVVAIFAVMGLVQLIKRKSIAKVDREILCLGGVYAVTLVTYALFEKVVINYRPIIEEGAEHVEASFPSSHTMLIVTVFATLTFVIGEYVKADKLQGLIRIVSLVIVCLTIVGRLVCGVHWFTDILGGCLISLCFINLFDHFLRKAD
ncbi:phosphatase PAP2 family protein [Butyrivibrio hungatei]|uniref:PAP2 family protein n=1 Tax=Butyrivibrio hungatei TaxID=185008 RepID=A0A1D9P057_9FIRM|nr:phosphatase PAP2 family protein [Butyrivibrio hungatei]AOZ95893.1 PAP2 family protein [Butyrivibrio hungatei]